MPGIDDESTVRTEKRTVNGNASIVSELPNGNANKPSSPSPSRRSLLKRSPAEDVHDLICIGFGPASLAIAVALNDSLANAGDNSDSDRIEFKQPKVAFIERQPRFTWHAGMLLPGAKMQISFIKDLATLRDPCSKFTFLNYLHQKGRLVNFINLGTFLPLRLEYEDYMRWCAEWFDDVVDYDHEVMSVTPKTLHPKSSKVDAFQVQSRNAADGQVVTRTARNVVIAVGGKPQIPKYFPQKHPRIIHSSAYSKAVPALLRKQDAPYRVAIIGSGQSAAEIFNDLHSRFPNAKTILIIKGSALRPSDDSPFVNEIFDPSHVDDVYRQQPNAREASLAADRGTNYGVVRLELLEHIYSELYTQRLTNQAEEDWQHRILNHREVSSIDDLPEHDMVRLHMRDSNSTDHTNGVSHDDVLDVDAVLVATGYVRNAHEDMLSSARHLLPKNGESSESWKVSRNYRLDLDPDKVSDEAGVWLQGCNENTHGLSDTLLSILATRGGELVQSIFGQGSHPES
ncbi:MAG: hypothetical protein M1833_006407 [Piccolia ochrophora]|nr:MAG: hypothetical protein M1833_006407 [Piccolia ochrophora]